MNQAKIAYMRTCQKRLASTGLEGMTPEEMDTMRAIARRELSSLEARRAEVEKERLEYEEKGVPALWIPRTLADLEEHIRIAQDVATLLGSEHSTVARYGLDLGASYSKWASSVQGVEHSGAFPVTEESVAKETSYLRLMKEAVRFEALKDAGILQIVLNIWKDDVTEVRSALETLVGEADDAMKEYARALASTADVRVHDIDETLLVRCLDGSGRWFYEGPASTIAILVDFGTQETVISCFELQYDSVAKVYRSVPVYSSRAALPYIGGGQSFDRIVMELYRMSPENAERRKKSVVGASLHWRRIVTTKAFEEYKQALHAHVRDCWTAISNTDAFRSNSSLSIPVAVSGSMSGFDTVTEFVYGTLREVERELKRSNRVKTYLEALKFPEPSQDAMALVGMSFLRMFHGYPVKFGVQTD